MYPNLYYAFKDLFGVEINFLKFINSFGFFVALSFILGPAVLFAELKRKSREGKFTPTDTTVLVGEKPKIANLLIQFILGFILGYKILGLFFTPQSDSFDPQKFIFSSQGSWPLGIGLGLLFAVLSWYDKNKQKLNKPETRIIRIWPQDRMGDITMMALVFGLLGAKVFDIFENWGDFLKYPSEYLLSPSGLTFYGGLICAAAAIWIYAYKHKINIWHLNDALSPVMMLVYGTGRIGCQVSGDGDWGIVNTTPNPISWLPDWLWSYNYPHNVNEQGVQIAGCVGRYCNQLAQPVYPTPLYEIAMALFLFAILWMLRKKFTIPGTLFALYLILNGMERFLIEKIRVNNKMTLWGMEITQAELISFSLILAGIVIWMFLKLCKKPVYFKDE